mmetsp:Transcript_66634/g.150514  ORF Transcript_66634/g.150514 Transcript_66634/m.150514 type:complete len:386 (+) Transcript_66634:60-1217(+)
MASPSFDEYDWQIYRSDPEGIISECANKMFDLEITLRCEICGEVQASPVSLPSCGHTYCSACVRSSFNANPRGAGCPTCRTACSTNDLKPNKALANTIAAFCAARDTVLAVVAALEQTRKAVPSNISEATASFGSERRDESPGGLGHAGGAAGASAGLIEPAGGSRRSPALEDSDFEDDSGPREGGGNARGGSGGGSGDGTQASYIPATVYSLLKDAGLRRECLKLGLVAKGDRKTLEWRHREFVKLHNASVDGGRSPVPAVIAKEVAEAERRLAASASQQLGVQDSVEQLRSGRLTAAARSGFQMMEAQLKARRGGGESEAQERSSGQPEVRHESETGGGVGGGPGGGEGVGPAGTFHPSAMVEGLRRWFAPDPWRVIWSSKKM